MKRRLWQILITFDESSVPVPGSFHELQSSLSAETFPDLIAVGRKNCCSQHARLLTLIVAGDTADHVLSVSARYFPLIPRTSICEVLSFGNDPDDLSHFLRVFDDGIAHWCLDRLVNALLSDAVPGGVKATIVPVTLQKGESITAKHISDAINQALSKMTGGPRPSNAVPSGPPQQESNCTGQ